MTKIVPIPHASPSADVSRPTRSCPTCPNFCAKFSSARRRMPTVAESSDHLIITGRRDLANARLVFSVASPPPMRVAAV